MSPATAAGDAGWNAWGVEILTPFGAVVAAAVALLVLAGLALSLRGLHTYLAPWQRGVIAVLRTAAAIAALIVFLEPAVVYKKVSRVRSRVAVLVDTSASMGFPSAPGGPPRRDAVAAWLGSNADALRRLSARYTVSAHTFDVEARPATLDAILSPATAGPGRGRGTDILRALDAAGTGDAPLSAVILVTDGADHADLARAFRHGNGAVTGTAAAFLKNLGAPIHVFLPGPPGAIKDAAVAEVAVPAVAFAGVETEIAATITSSGFGTVDLPVVLRSGGQILQTQTVHLTAARPRAGVAFKFTPPRPASGVVAVSIPVLAGDADPENNTRYAVLKTVRDRTRVLQVAGGPSWDVRFLRQFLKRSPGTDLISFFILRTVESQVNAPDDELSLIPFPTDEVFRAHLDTFDAVVFQDFNFSPYGMHGYLPGLARFVDGGGGLLVAGGNRSLSTGEYRASAIDPALPVSVGTGDRAVSIEPFQPVLTAAGKVHPLTALSADVAENEALWRNIPSIGGLNLADAVRDGATVLLAHPFLRMPGGGPAPVLAAWEHGKGRVAILMTDESWRWDFSEAAFGESRVYRRFFENAIRWLAGEPSFERLRVDDDTAPRADTPAVLRGIARGADFSPLAGALVSATFRGADRANMITVETTAGADGRFALPIDAVPGGAYTVEVSASAEGSPAARTTQEVLVDTRDPETASPVMDDALVRAVAAATGGAVHVIPMDSVGALRLPDRAQEIVDKKEYRPLWDRAWIIVALCLCLAAEWFLRRRWGQQ